MTTLVESILEAAKAMPPKDLLEGHKETVDTLRAKGYSWREIAAFLNLRGVDVDHSKLYRRFVIQK